MNINQLRARKKLNSPSQNIDNKIIFIEKHILHLERLMKLFLENIADYKNRCIPDDGCIRTIKKDEKSPLSISRDKTK